MLIKTNAIVLNRISYSETSLICRLFTQDEGKVSILAKGALRPKKTIGALNPKSAISKYINDN